MWVIRPEESEQALPSGHLEEEYSWLQESKSKVSEKTIYVFEAKQDEWKERSWGWMVMNNVGKQMGPC